MFDPQSLVGLANLDLMVRVEGLLHTMPEWNYPTNPVVIEGGGHRATFLVSTDYAGVETDTGYFRLPATPKVYERVAEAHGWALPFPELVDATHRTVPRASRGEPRSMSVRNGVPSWIAHNAAIEDELNALPHTRLPLVVGRKKDVVVGQGNPRGAKKPPHLSVVIYGWHSREGKPIQSVFDAHAVGYLDYSHGWRPVSRGVDVDGVIRDYHDVLADAPLCKALFGREVKWTRYC